MSDDIRWPAGTRQESFGFLLIVLARRMDATVRVRLNDLDVDDRFFTNLMVLLARDGLSQRELGRYGGFPEYQTSRTTDAMVAAGLVERRPCPTSRRTRLIHLTDKGRHVAQQLPAQVKDVNEDFLEVLTADERADLVHLMQQLYEFTSPISEERPENPIDT